VPDPPAGVHVEEVVVEAPVSRGVGLLALGAVAEEAQRGERPSGGLATREEAALRGHDIGGEAEPGGRDAARGAFARAVGDQPVVRIRGAEEVADGVALKRLEILHAR